MASSHEKRRRIRAEEARRDTLIIKKETITKDLAKARLALKQAKKSK
jgi:hypothetical protein